MKSLQHRVTRLDSAVHKGKERPLSAVNLIVLHATASGKQANGRAVVAYMNRTDHGPISYHYVLERDGSILRMCDPAFTAYHAGVSAWPRRPVGRESVNKRSIGISFVNDNIKEPLTELQFESAEWLCLTWMQKLGIPATSVVGHREVAPDRKTDPATLPLGAWRLHLSR